MRGRGWGSVSCDSPHLVVFEREIQSASEQGDAQPGGVGVGGSGVNMTVCWIIVWTYEHATIACHAIECGTIRAVTIHRIRRVRAVEASGGAALRVFHPKHEAARSRNRGITVVPRCSRVAAEGESVGGAHNDQRGPLRCSVSK